MVLSTLAEHFPQIYPEVLAAARQIKDEYMQARVLSTLAKHFPEIYPEALAAARQIKNEYHRALVLSSLAEHFPQIYPEALAAARQLEDEDDRARALSSYIFNGSKIFNNLSYDFWCEFIHTLSSLKRAKFLTKISESNLIIEKLAEVKTFREIANSINQVGRWFA